jgi:hypothetical protein
VEKEIKKCSVCENNYERTNEFFQKCSQKKDGLRPECKSCSKAKKKTKAYLEYLEKRKLERASIRIEYFSSEEYKAILIESKEKDSIRKKKWALENKEILRIRGAERRKSGKIKPLSAEKRKEYKKSQYEKIKSDPYKRMIALARGRMRCFVKKEAKKFIIKDMLIFTADEFKSHIESKFNSGMNWDNYGQKGWHIDHIKPISKFDLNDLDQCKECWSLSNLQPLWWKDNLSKSNKIF